MNQKMKQTLAIGGSVLVCAGMAHADLVEIGASAVENGIDGVQTIQIWAQFDDASDLIMGVSTGTDRLLEFALGGSASLVNFGDSGGANPTDDDPGNHPWDSAIGFSGDLAGVATLKTPDFWGVPGGGLGTGVLDDGINGLSDDNSGYFIGGGVPVGSLDSGNRITIAQFSYTGSHGQGAFMSGMIQYNFTEFVNFTAYAFVPGPGALALFGLAAVGRRRRRVQ